jgi:hypothetical protein
MKKIIYSILFCLATSFVFTSCTEEEVAPTSTELNGGGTGQVERGM